MRDLEHLRRRYADHVPGLLGARHSYAVLCPLVERPDGLHLLFEVRSAALHRQPGEVCFPGGRMEAGETPEQCALRETWEELGIPPEDIRLLGRADFLHLRSEALMHPVLGRFPYARVQAPPDYRWTPGQVEVPVYDGLPYPLWGLTARITRHVVQLATEGAE